MHLADRALDRLMFGMRALVISETPARLLAAAAKGGLDRTEQVEEMLHARRAGFRGFLRDRVADRLRKGQSDRHLPKRSYLKHLHEKPALLTPPAKQKPESFVPDRMSGSDGSPEQSDHPIVTDQTFQIVIVKLARFTSRPDIFGHQ